ncbi:(dimethylallyl)adenosine tRNA methylthiotransferase [Yersinia pseudotuberculosis]|uniref:(Dimethylallyl)adenosine tRNA methylthiotransferase n=1 Tax=Yersinia pseudotuberculosis TaxID=633 RepID=A0A380QBJ5_YERPU|nr:(dimethylallyl)adenosine tRNA methylthiotransferase [Yersinia pseudotuberculosis]
MLPNDEAFATLYYNGDYLPQRRLSTTTEYRTERGDFDDE